MPEEQRPGEASAGDPGDARGAQAMAQEALIEDAREKSHDHSSSQKMRSVGHSKTCAKRKASGRLGM